MKEAYKPASFSLELGLKDATLINEQAEISGANMPLATFAKQELQQLLKMVMRIMTGAQLL